MIIKYHLGVDIYFISVYNGSTKKLVFYVKEIDKEKSTIQFIKVKSQDFYQYITEKRKDLHGLFYGCLKTVITDPELATETKLKFFRFPENFLKNNVSYQKL